MKRFDSHCHYEDSQFDGDRYQLLDELQADDFGYIMNCCSDVSVFQQIEEIVNRYDFAYCSFGVHPLWAEGTPEDYLEMLTEKLKHPKCVALGEIGLDYSNKPDKDLQKRLFKEQLELAKQLNKPVIIHDRDAHKDTMDILRYYQPKGILHRYGGNSQLMLEAVKWGMYVSVNNDCTHPNWPKRHLEMLEKIPLDRLLVETDCPYGPVYNTNHRRTDSRDVVYAIERIAQLRKEPVETIERVTYENALRVYEIEGEENE